MNRKATKKEHDCFELLDSAERKGRARYSCIFCKRDVSLAWFYYQLAIKENKQ